MKKKIITLVIVIFAAVNFAYGQTTEIKISLDEQFFDALLEAIFKNLDAPGVPLTSANQGLENRVLHNPALTDDISKTGFQNVSFDKKTHEAEKSPAACDESIRLQREIDGVKTAVRFRQGKIYAPIAFKGNYNPPLIGCIEFQGWAEANIELEFDKRKNALIGRAKILNVNLSGTGGIGSSYLARFVQSSIDKKINPIEIIALDKLSFTAPVQNSGKLKMKAIGIRYQIVNKTLDVYLKYEFLKG